jgi:antirestriction protein ArdC
VSFTPLAFEPIEAAESIAKSYADGPAIEHQGQEAYYRPSIDTVRLPTQSRFASTEEYYSTLFHELAHSTGHSNRLSRGLDETLHPFGSPDYGKEELIAEMAAAFLSAHAGIKPAVIENQAAYIGSWTKTLKSDKRLVIQAAGAAQKAADWIRGKRP